MIRCYNRSFQYTHSEFIHFTMEGADIGTKNKWMTFCDSHVIDLCSAGLAGYADHERKPPLDHR